MPREVALGQAESSKPTPSQPSSQLELHFQVEGFVSDSSPQWLMVAISIAAPALSGTRKP